MTEKEALGIWLPLIINSYEGSFKTALMMAYDALAEKSAECHRDSIDRKALLAKIWDMPKPKEDSNYWDGVDDVSDIISAMPSAEREAMTNDNT